MSQEIRVRFESCDGTDGDGRFRVTFTDVAGNECGVAGEFAPFLTDDDYENLRWYLEEYMDLPDGGAVVRAQGIEQQLHQWGRRLYDALFAAPENLALLKQLLAGPEPRELTIATDQSALLRLPWELMADDAGNLAQRLSVRRQLATRTEERTAFGPSAAADALHRQPAVGYGLHRPAHDDEGSLRGARSAGQQCPHRFLPAPHTGQHGGNAPRGQAAGAPYHVVHFDGHGTFLPEAGIGALCFEKPDDGSGDSQTDFVRADRLGNLLAKYHIPLVVLEACRSATVGKMSVFRSVAPRLIQAGVGSVLSMGHAVHVEAARVLLDRFYRELVRGTTIGHAVAQARGALISRPRAGSNTARTAARSRWRTGFSRTSISAVWTSRSSRVMRPLSRQPCGNTISSSATITTTPPASRRWPGYLWKSTVCASGWTNGNAGPASWNRSARRASATAVSRSLSARKTR
jgi:CHAT domain-containing protein